MHKNFNEFFFIFVGTGSYEFILTEKKGAKQNVGLITLNRPKALNALCDKLVAELSDAVSKFDSDDSVGALVITGSEKAFAAGKLLGDQFGIIKVIIFVFFILIFCKWIDIFH